MQHPIDVVRVSRAKSLAGCLYHMIDRIPFEQLPHGHVLCLAAPVQAFVHTQSWREWGLPWKTLLHERLIPDSAGSHLASSWGGSPP